MAITNRAARLNRLFQVAKKHYEPVKPPGDRSVLEHILYACCLENSGFDETDEAFARLQQDYFDWNEVRVTTVVELSEVMSCLSEPSEAASRLKRTLHSVFEANYAFDLDALKKENLGQAIDRLAKYKGMTPFVVSYATQQALGGHAIAVDRATIRLMSTLGAISNAEASKRVVPGLERAIPKSKGHDFFSVIHQLAVSLQNSPFSPEVRKVVLEIEPEAQLRLPKRGGRRPAAGDGKRAGPSKAAADGSAGGKPAPAGQRKSPGKTPDKSKSRGARPASPKSGASRSNPKKGAPAAASSEKKKSTTKRLARKKPR